MKLSLLLLALVGLSAYAGSFKVSRTSHGSTEVVIFLDQNRPFNDLALFAEDSLQNQTFVTSVETFNYGQFIEAPSFRAQNSRLAILTIVFEKGESFLISDASSRLSFRGELSEHFFTALSSYEGALKVTGEGEGQLSVALVSVKKEFRGVNFVCSKQLDQVAECTLNFFEPRSLAVT